MIRNFSIETQFQRLAATHVPLHRFCSERSEEWRIWRNSLLPKCVTSLGRMPRRVALHLEVVAEWEQDGLIKQRIVFNVDDGLAVAGLLLRPRGTEQRLPGILACHGHGPYGKDAVMGDRSDAARGANIESHNYDYGLQMAKAGFAVIAIDWRGFGERDDRQKPHFRDVVQGRDICNVHFLRASILGMTLLGLNVHDAKCALDVLCAQEFVDPSRIGVMGLSFGGTMATWISVCDDRIRAADVICYSDRFADFAMRDANFCGSQMTPGLYELCDLPDLHGLIAPRPLLVEIGSYDQCFSVDSAMSCYREVQKIYAAAGASDKLELDLFDGGHRWGANKSVAFFRKYLSGNK